MLFREIAEKEYKPVVEIISDGFRSQIEGDVFRIIHSYGINVDKGELIKALQYDRQQYEKGFIDGCRGAVADIKAEVAREILREIYAGIFEMLPLKVFRLIDDNYVEKSFESGKERAFHDVLNYIAELEKKYTEEKT